jgi:hypothetical protein
VCIRGSSEERWHFRETPCVVVTLHLVEESMGLSDLDGNKCG